MTLRNLLGTIAVLAIVAAGPARAGGFSTTNAQILQGFNFDDDFVGHPKHGNRTTLTLNTFSTWEYGDSFAFADLTRDDYSKSDTGSVYLEWHPRLFLDQVLGQKGPMLGVIRHWGLAGEVNQGGFSFGTTYAYLAGVGFDFEVPVGWVLGLNLFYRYDSASWNQYQISPYWTVPFSLGKVPFLFTGFVDVNGTKRRNFGTGESKQGVEVWAQPQLLVDVLAPFGGKAGKLYAGVEWYYHYLPAGPELKAITSSVPQAMVQWTIF